MADEKLLNELKKDITKANRRLLALEKFTGKPYSWAGQKLYDELSVEKLNAWSSKNRIILNKNMTDEELRRVKASVDDFLNKKTSTVRNVKKRAAQIKSSFKSGISVSDEQAEHIYQAFEEDVIKWALRYIDASELWALIGEAKETKMSEERFNNEFLKRAKNVGNIDLDFRDNLLQLYTDEVEE